MMKRMDVATGMRGVGGLALDTGVGFGASYAIGQVHARYRDKWFGKNAPYLAGAVGKLGAVALSVFSGSPGLGVGVLDAIGQAGVNAIGLDMGLRHARKSTGKQAVLLPAGAALPAGGVAIGALGKAPVGKGLGWDQIEELAQGR